MKCPICQTKVGNDAPFMPFCSERCKLLDLSNWASEKYVISTPVTQDPDDEFDEQMPEGN